MFQPASPPFWSGKLGMLRFGRPVILASRGPSTLTFIKFPLTQKEEEVAGLHILD